MDQDTKEYFNEFKETVKELLTSMEKRLEDKLDAFMRQSSESHKIIDQRHENFRADIKQLYGRTDLLEKNQIMLESRVNNIEKSEEKKETSGRFRWEIAVAFGSILVAIAAIFFGG